MIYNYEKYRDKREKVLGVRKRGISFGMMVLIVSGVIILGLGGLAVPRAIAYLTTRNLDDAIYKMADSKAWSQEVVTLIANQPGVTRALTDNHDTRLVVTFNRNETGPEKFKNIFLTRRITADLLNRMDHRNRMSILKKEAEFEAL
ncbi:MAG: hypothetical protein KJ950_11620 [Proteobacteria bacterium]|nr:hypothetical protein [Pseudomonadota bacterium]MBU1687989.1 hypothetical protein [Pseudomonadota bacterium]